MRKLLILFFSAGIPALLSLLPCRGELTTADSVEWMVCKSDFVAFGHVVRVVPFSTAHSGDFVRITMSLDSVLKGDLPDTDTSFIVPYRDLVKAGLKLGIGDRLIVMLHQRFSPNEWGQNVPCLVPTNDQGPLSVIGIHAKLPDLYDSDNEKVESLPHLLQICRRAAGLTTRETSTLMYPPPPPGSIGMWMPEDAVCIRVPQVTMGGVTR